MAILLEKKLFTIKRIFKTHTLSVIKKGKKEKKLIVKNDTLHYINYFKLNEIQYNEKAATLLIFFFQI